MTKTRTGAGTGGRRTGERTGRRAGGRAGPGRPESAGRSNEVSGLLSDLRRARGLSLREVEDATEGAVSNAYLSQLENGRIKQPSPNVLHRLAEVYAVPYEALMEKAGYLLPSVHHDGRRGMSLFAIDDLSAEEEEELLKYLAFLRWRHRP